MILQIYNEKSKIAVQLPYLFFFFFLEFLEFLPF